MDYPQAKQLLGTARDPNAGKPIENNTRLRALPDGSIALRLHDTDILTFRKNGAVIYNSGGWKTVTTKQRMNAYGPARIWSDRGTWYIGMAYATRQNGEDTAPAKVFQDGVKVYRGKITGAAKDDGAERKTRGAVGAYVKAYMGKLLAGEIPAPSNGDCWGCCMRADDGSRPMGGEGHIRQHMEEKYYVPSLLLAALERMGASIAEKHNAAVRLKVPGSEGIELYPGEWFDKQTAKHLRKYMLRELGMAA